MKLILIFLSLFYIGSAAPCMIEAKYTYEVCAPKALGLPEIAAEHAGLLLESCAMYEQYMLQEVKDEKLLVSAISGLSKSLGISSSYHPLLFDQLVLEYYPILTAFLDKRIGLLDASGPLDASLIAVRSFIDKIYYEYGWWNEGRRLASELLTNSGSSYLKEVKENQKSHLRAIINLMWYFYQCAGAKKQFFAEGTFNIEGKEIYDFIFEYVRNYLDCKSRISSHYSEFVSIGFEHYGIDIPSEDRSFLTLPNGKKHVLLGIIMGSSYKKDIFMFFVKPEMYGVTEFSDFFGHAYEYCESQIKKLFTSHDDADHCRKERVPKAILAAWKAYYNSISGTVDDALMKEIAQSGIQAIVFQLSDKFFLAAKNEHYYNLMALLKEYDHTEIRKGREVILRTDELLADKGKK